MSTADFYDRLSPFYHLIYADWEASVQRQAAQLDEIIRGFWGDRIETILDAACGIGTQALGLAGRGYHVTASDLSPQAIQRARQEAQKYGLQIDFSVGDMRTLAEYHPQKFDLVMACDNAIPHLLSDEEILGAFRQFFECTRPGGGVLITVRDYDREQKGGTQVKPYGVRVEAGKRYLVFQVWDFEGDQYEATMYFVEDDRISEPVTRVMHSQYYAVGSGKLIELMEQAGFAQVQRLDEAFFQPVIIAKKVISSRLLPIR